MACIGNDGNGRRRILFVAPDGRRRTNRLGKIDQKSAEAISRHVESLLSSKVSGQPIRQETAVWVAGLGERLNEKLAAAGLIEKKEKATLGGFLETFIANRRPTAAPGTIINLEQARRRLVEFFGAERDLGGITPGNAEAWAAALAEKLAPATAGRTIKRARQFFKAALRQKLISENPFIDIKASGQANKERQFHVGSETILRVINAAPDAQWRLIIALSRYGGLRCPSEHLALRWGDVDWARNRFRVDSPKTGERWIPIFPELRPYLEECFELAPEGVDYIITRYRDTNANLRTTFTKIIRRAGEKPWAKLFHNLRASRETELAASYPIHVVCSWIGNSPAIAAKHYLMVREADFVKATRGGAESGTVAAQNQAQQAAAVKGKKGTKMTQAESGKSFMPLPACTDNSWQNAPVTSLGLEEVRFLAEILRKLMGKDQKTTQGCEACITDYKTHPLKKHKLF